MKWLIERARYLSLIGGGGLLVGAVAVALAAFNYVSEKEKMDELEIHPEAEETRAQDLKN